jgi:hypothetical protein
MENLSFLFQFPKTLFLKIQIIVSQYQLFFSSKIDRCSSLMDRYPPLSFPITSGSDPLFNRRQLRDLWGNAERLLAGYYFLTSAHRFDFNLQETASDCAILY